MTQELRLTRDEAANVHSLAGWRLNMLLREERLRKESGITHAASWVEMAEAIELTKLQMKIERALEAK